MGIETALIGIGSAVAGFFTGGAITVAAGTLSATIAGVIGGALVGAAVGGITSAIMGGNIMQGVLFGAVGGAVTGGLSGYFAGGAGAGGFAAPVAPGAGQMASNLGMSVTETAALMSGGTEVVATTTAQSLANVTIGGSLKALGGSLVKEFGGDFVKGLASAYMKGEELEAMNKAKLKEMQLASDLKMKELKTQAELAAKYGGGGGGSAPDHSLEIAKMQQQTERERMAENRRQFDVGHDERMLARSDIQAKESDRQALFKGYKGRAGVSSGQGDGTGAYVSRQEQALAAVEGGQPLTGGEGDIVINQDEEALA